jgi:ATP-binding cassette subfamily B protein IrtA
MSKPDASDAEVQAAAQLACAHQFIVEDLAKGYGTVVGERGAGLSGGQRQRITIARALLSDARVVILDEATAFVDPEYEAAIHAAVARLCQGRTVLVIAHRLATITDTDQIVVLHLGRVREHGTHHDLIAAGGSYADLWGYYSAGSAWGLGGSR